MASLGEVGTSSFDAYEGIRIFIPGAVAFALGTFAAGTVAPDLAGSIRDDAIISLIASLILGLILYYWDLPARSAAALVNQPTAWLEAEYPKSRASELLTVYFEILNTVMPGTIRNRALYMGSMYRIGLELILTLATSSAVVIGFSLMRSLPVSPSLGLTSHRWWAVAALVASFVIAFLISVSYERKVNYRVGRQSAGLVGRSLRGLAHTNALLYAVGAAMLVGSAYLYGNRYPAAVAGAPWVGLAGYLICFGYWIVRYVKGDRVDDSDPRKRKPIPAPTSAVLLLFPLAWVLISRTGPSDPLSSDRSLAAWTAVLALAILSIILRGHERKLHGSYAGQTRWLKHNKALYERIIDPILPIPDPAQANSLVATQGADDRPLDSTQATRSRSFLDRVRAAVRAWRG